MLEYPSRKHLHRRRHKFFETTLRYKGGRFHSGGGGRRPQTLEQNMRRLKRLKAGSFYGTATF